MGPPLKLELDLTLLIFSIYNNYGVAQGGYKSYEKIREGIK